MGFRKYTYHPVRIEIIPESLYDNHTAYPAGIFVLQDFKFLANRMRKKSHGESSTMQQIEYCIRGKCNYENIIQ